MNPKIKTTKKLYALLLTFALIMSVFMANTEIMAESSSTADSTDTTESSATADGASTADNAALTDTITVTLRVEDTDKTLIPSTQVTLRPEDIETINSTFVVRNGSVESGNVENVPLLPNDTTAAHAIAKYMIDHSNTPTEDLIFNTSYYGGSHNVSHIKGEHNADNDYAWSYRVNNAYPVIGSMDQYKIKNGDSIVLYYSECYDPDSSSYTGYSFFEQECYETAVHEKVTLTLKRENGEYDENWIPLTVPASNGTVSVRKNGSNAAPTIAITDDNGAISMSFDEAGTYTITSEHFAEDGLCVNSRAYAVVTVKDAAAETPTPAPSTPSAAAPTQTPSVTQSVTPSSATPSLTPSQVPAKAAKPAAPPKLKITVKKKDLSSSRKNVTFSWKKVKSATGYHISLSKNSKKNFKPFASTKKTKITRKLKKGTYYAKVRSYITVDGKKLYGKYSKIVMFKVR